MDIKALEIVMNDKAARREYLSHDLFSFWKYYFFPLFKAKSAQFHKEWVNALRSDDHVSIKAFREAAKTVWLSIFYVWCIAYKKRRFITHYSFEMEKSEALLFDIVLSLQTNERILEDFGNLYPGSIKGGIKQKAGVSEFVTTNGVRVKAMSIGMSPRGLIFQTKDGAFRPDLIGLDDIDVLKSVQNPKTIQKNYEFVKGEIIGGMSDRAKIVLLGNVIKQDGVVPRMESDYHTAPDWRIFKQPIRDKLGKITWPERFVETDAEAQETGKTSLETKLRDQGSTAFAQNFLLIPAMDGDTVIRREFIRYGETETADRIVIGVDPAFSTKSLSDAFAIVVTAHFDRKKYVRACYALQGTDKEYEKATEFIFKIYKESNADIVNFESVAFQTILAQLLKQKWVAVREVKPHADKVTRLMEFQADFERGDILFDRDWPWIKELIEELLAFPNGIHDDRVDGLGLSFLKKKPGVFVWSV